MNPRPIKEIVRQIGRLSARWLSKNYSYRQKALKKLVTRSHFSRKQAEAILDSIFSELTGKKILALLRLEFGNPLRLDGQVRGPDIILHILPGNVPNPAIFSFVFGILVKSKNICKVSGRDGGFLDVYLASLRGIDPRLAAGHRLLPPKSKASLRRHYKKAGLVVAYGSDETLARIQKDLPPAKPFIGHGHRVSLGFYTRAAMKKRNIRNLAGKAAHDIWMMDRRGCLSPSVIYVEKGGEVSPKSFSRMLKEPYLVRAFEKRESVFWSLSHLRGALSTVALEAAPSERKRLAARLVKLGANRICRAGQMQHPLLARRHDGRPNLADWVW
ncbi:MAG: hypothetical protein HYZ52_00725 [Candidatus Omnitrophica bacterium]|nr:hypothetical protein [Candidatus Omnitrophota bacterium]